ncbi:MAG: radical SAM protein [Pseudomonadota bacterium]
MPRKLRVLIVYPNIPMMLVAPLATAIFTWILRQEGHDVQLFETTRYWDGNLNSPQNRVKYLQARSTFAQENLESLKPDNMEVDFRNKLEEYRPDLLLYSFTEDALLRALHLLRISNPMKIPSIIGGVLATSDPEWVISFPEVKILCVGEGEEVVRDVARRLARGQDLSGIPNLWIKKTDGSVERNGMRPYVNLDHYSADFSVFDPSRFVRPMGGKIHRALPIETYRGCPNRCTYCNSPMHNRIAREQKRVYLRRRTIEGSKNEIRNLVDNYRANLLYFVDDSFLARPRREINDFIDMYKEFRTPFWFNTRPEHCTGDILQRLKEVGVFRGSFGVESGNEEFRRKYLHRNVSNRNLLSHFEIIKDSGIRYSINCIIGLPFETREMVFDTIRLVRQIRGYDAITVSIFTPYRGTILRRQAIDAGWLDAEALTVHTTSTSMLNMPNFTAKQIDGLMQTFPLYVEFEESLWPEIERIERFEPGWRNLLETYSQIYRENHWGVEDR